MAGSDDLDLSIGKGARILRDFRPKLLVWVLETLGEAFGTGLILIALAFVQFWHEEPPPDNDFSLYKFLGISIFVLFYFGMTGYLATTLISRFALRGKVQFFYPYVCAGLYFLHSTIFFVGLGNPFLRREDLTIQICGSLLTLACTCFGNRLVAHWTKSRLR